MVSAVADLSQGLTISPAGASASLRAQRRKSAETRRQAWILVMATPRTPVNHRRRPWLLRSCAPARAGGAENVEHSLPCRDQVVRNDAPVAAPPHGFGAHDGATPFVSQCAQARQRASERWGERLVGS